MAHRRKNYLIYIQSCPFGNGFVNSGNGCSQVKDLDYAAALRTEIAAVIAADIISGNPPLFIGRTCQRNQCVLPGNTVLYLYCIPYRIDVLNRGFHSVIDDNAVLYAETESGFLCKCDVRSDADGKYHKVSAKCRCIFQQNIYFVILFFKSLHGLT